MTPDTQARDPISGSFSLDDRDLLLRQPVELIDEGIDRVVGDVNLLLQDALGLRRIRVCKLLVQREHPLDKSDHPVVPRNVGGIVEVDRADRNL